MVVGIAGLDGDDFVGVGLGGFVLHGFGWSRVSGRGGLGESRQRDEEATCAEERELWHDGKIVHSK
jgi:hypothetical protein